MRRLLQSWAIARGELPDRLHFLGMVQIREAQRHARWDVAAAQPVAGSGVIVCLHRSRAPMLFLFPCSPCL